MHIVVLDAANGLPTDEESEDQPMGGIRSALTYLGDALAGAGHTVTAIGPGDVVQNRSAQRRSGMTGIGLANIPVALFQAADAFIINCRGDHASLVRDKLRDDAPLILWQHHLPVVRHLSRDTSIHGLDTPHRDRLDAVVFVSEWQRRLYEEQYPLQAIGRHVIRNAVAPAFLALDDGDDALFERKASQLEVAFVSSHERGLGTLLGLWRSVVPCVPQAQLAVYFARTPGLDDRSGEYDRFTAGEPIAPNVVYRGGLPHGELCRHLGGTAVIAYPTRFEETSCIALLEGLAAGCRVVCTDRGALPESMAGYARMVQASENEAELAQRFLPALIDELRRWQAGDPGLRRQLAHQRRVFRACDWRARALEWESLIAFLRQVRAARETSGC
jgi:glycosyltransferase involved in cell wall biosynthesis